MELLQNKNAETVGRATKRAARELTGDRELCGHDGPGQRVCHVDRELPENAVHGTKRPEGPGHKGGGSTSAPAAPARHSPRQGRDSSQEKNFETVV